MAILKLLMPHSTPEKRREYQRNFRRKVVIIDKTMPDDTTTRENIMRWREEEYQAYLKKKEKANA